MPLFRAEAVLHRANRLSGNVNIATPVRWQLISLLLLATLMAAVLFLANARYARVEVATGTITLDKGVASVVTSRPGVLMALAASDGRRVRAGQVLGRVRSEEDLVGSATAPDRIQAALTTQNARLAAQGKALLAAADAERGRLQVQIAGSTKEVASLVEQIADQGRLVDLAEADYENTKRVAAIGYVSRRDMDARQATVLTRRQQLAQLQQLAASKRSTISEARRSILQNAAASQAQLAGSQSERAALEQQLAQTELARGYAITSPIDGVVTGQTGRVGQPVAALQPLMMVVPHGSRLRAELLIPTSAAGFVQRGQEVRLTIDAFPFEQFGTVPARIAGVSGAALARPAGSGAGSTAYLVTLDLPRPWITAFGRRQRLVPGMTLGARIVTNRRTLIEWLFEPLFAVRSR